jgi:hypothetical protein
VILPVTVKTPLVDPAVYRPVGEIVPPVAVHVTLVFAVPEIAAVNWCDAPVARLAVDGDTVIDGIASVLVTRACVGGFGCCAASTVPARTIAMAVTMPRVRSRLRLALFVPRTTRRPFPAS